MLERWLSTGYSFRGPSLKSQHLHGGAKLSVTLVPGYKTPSSGLQGYFTHMVYIHVYKTLRHINLKKIKEAATITVLHWTTGTNLNTDEEVKPDVCVCTCYQTYLLSWCICWEGLDTVDYTWCPDLTLVVSRNY